VKLSVGVGVNVGRGVGVEVGLTIGVGVGVGENLGVAVGVCFSVGNGVGERVGKAVDGGNSSIGVSADSISGDGRSGSLAAGVGFGVDPGSNQLLTLLPLTNVACSLVFPWSRMTGPSNFPRTILPV
jgi:hypothetical protein